MCVHFDPDPPILLVGDEEPMLRSLSAALMSNGMPSVLAVSDRGEALSILARQEVAFLLLDLVVPHAHGRELLEVVLRDHPDVPVVVAAMADDVETAVECTKKGAFDYIVKPIEEQRLFSVCRRAIASRDARQEAGRFPKSRHSVMAD